MGRRYQLARDVDLPGRGIPPVTPHLHGVGIVCIGKIGGRRAGDVDVVLEFYQWLSSSPRTRVEAQNQEDALPAAVTLPTVGLRIIRQKRW